jgi:hypothetical protein
LLFLIGWKLVWSKFLFSPRLMIFGVWVLCLKSIYHTIITLQWHRPLTSRSNYSVFFFENLNKGDLISKLCCMKDTNRNIFEAEEPLLWHRKIGFQNIGIPTLVNKYPGKLSDLLFCINLYFFRYCLLSQPL